MTTTPTRTASASAQTHTMPYTRIVHSQNTDSSFYHHHFADKRRFHSFSRWSPFITTSIENSADRRGYYSFFFDNRLRTDTAGLSESTAFRISHAHPVQTLTEYKHTHTCTLTLVQWDTQNTQPQHPLHATCATQGQHCTHRKNRKESSCSIF